jgi:hypothetical protein
MPRLRPPQRLPVSRALSNSAPWKPVKGRRHQPTGPPQPPSPSTHRNPGTTAGHLARAVAAERNHAAAGAAPPGGAGPPGGQPARQGQRLRQRTDQADVPVQAGDHLQEPTSAVCLFIWPSQDGWVRSCRLAGLGGGARPTLHRLVSAGMICCCCLPVACRHAGRPPARRSCRSPPARPPGRRRCRLADVADHAGRLRRNGPPR